MKFAPTHVREFTLKALGFTDDCLVVDMSKADNRNQIGIVILPDQKYIQFHMTSSGSGWSPHARHKAMSDTLQAQLKKIQADPTQTWRFSTVADATGGEYIY
jgi:hypothetical protein